MFYWIYYGSLIIVVPGLILAFIAEIMVKSAYNKYRKIPSSSNWTASDSSRMLLEKNNCNVIVQSVPGTLTDNYDPSTQILSLSENVYNDNSIASLAIAAHEVGHACQHEDNYLPLKFRSLAVPIVNIGSRIALPLAIVGLLLGWLAASLTQISEIILFVAIIAYSLSTVFALITLPVEFNASRRAKKMLIASGVLSSDEIHGASKVLNAAALTYVASLFVSLLYLVRFIIILSSLKRD